MRERIRTQHIHIRASEDDKEFNKKLGGDSMAYQLLKEFWLESEKLDLKTLEKKRKEMLKNLGYNY